MVKGRRVRAVVACARNDDCCSPNPKRRGQNTFNKAILQPNKTNTITAFFQTVDVDIDSTIPVDDDASFKPLENGKKQDNDEVIIDLCQNELTAKTGDVSTTPVMIRRLTPCNESGPPTPHRIELCAENGVKDGAKVDKELPKTKKRMNHLANHKLTEYFPVRRSVRKTKKTVLEERQRTLEQMLRGHVEEGLEVRIFSDKGRGVITSRPFSKGDFVVEYSGDLIDISEAKKREQQYAQDLSTGCYMYYFKHNNQQYCVDATAETGKLGRLVNHSRNGNLVTRTVPIDNKPRLVLIAKEDIKEGEEVTYDYGDRSKESLKHHPWLAN